MTVREDPPHSSSKMFLFVHLHFVFQVEIIIIIILVIYNHKQDLENSGMVGQISAPTCFVNTVLLECSHAGSFTYSQCPLSCYTGTRVQRPN